MFTPKMPSLIVLVGDGAANEAEHMVSSLRDHVDKDYLPLMQAVCLISDESRPAFREDDLLQPAYTLDSIGDRQFAAIVRDRQKDIMNRAAALGNRGIQYGQMYIAFVVRGSQVPAQTLLRFLREAREYLAVVNCTLKSVLCYLTEEDAARHSAQADWLRDPDQPEKVKAGFLEFDHFLILSERHENGMQSYETKNQQQEAFPLGLLAAYDPYMIGQKLYTMRFGKINGSTYEINRLLRHAVADALENWASRPIGTPAGWEALSTRDMRLEGVTGEESLLNALRTGMEAELPQLGDLAAVGLEKSELSMEQLVLSFDQVNKDRMFTRDESGLWADRWGTGVRSHLKGYPQLDGLILLLQADGPIGKAVHSAWVGADRRLREIDSPEEWLAHRWRNAYMPDGPKFLESKASYNLRCLKALLPDYQELCLIRGIAARLKLLKEQCAALLEEMARLTARRKALLGRHRLAEAEEAVLTNLCQRYCEEINSRTHRQQVNELTCYHEAEQTLYDPELMDTSWRALYEEMLQRAMPDRKSFAQAFITGMMPIALKEKIVDHTAYNDGTLLAELPMAVIPQTPRAVYLVPQEVLGALPGDVGAGFAAIPGDLIERVTFVPLGEVNDLLTLKMFKPYEMGELPDIKSVKSPETTVAKELQKATTTENPWNVSLVEEGDRWWLYWKWVGAHDRRVEIRYDGKRELVSYSTWQQHGERHSLDAGSIPYGRFTVTLDCGGDTATVWVTGKTLRLTVDLHKDRKKVKLPLGEGILQARFCKLDGSGLTAAKESGILLQLTKGRRTFVYDLFGILSMDHDYALGPVYVDEDAEITLEGRGAMEGYVEICMTGDC